MKLPQKSTGMQFIKFGAVGILNTLISLIIYYFFLYIDKRLYLIGKTIGWIVSVGNAFFWNNKFVFFSESNTWKDTLAKLKKTYLSYGATFLLTIILLYIEVDMLNWSAVLCPIINLLITIPVNFILNKFWAFRKAGK